MDKVNVVILAGDRKASLLVEDDNKAFLKVNNIPCIIYTLKAFLESEKAGNIVIVGPSSRLKKTLKEYKIPENSRIKIIEQRESLIENCEEGYIASLDNLSEPYGTDIKSLDREKYKEFPVLMSSCDIPIITPEEIDEFITAADTSKYDYYIGLCSEEVLKHYYPDNENPGMMLNYFHVKEGNYRVNNLHLVKPLKIERLEYIERMYELRYQKHFFNMFKLLIRILFNGRGVIRAFFKALKLHMALYCFDRGYMKLYPRFKEKVRIDRVFNSIGHILGTRVSYIITSYGGAALDIDHPEDKEVIEKMYDRWMNYQNNLKPGK
jgi:GTP:adenosylcobinamide-phosphate guanylyltransferase